MFTLYLGDLKYQSEGIGNNVMPLNVGFIASYLNSNLRGQISTRIFKDPNLLLEAVQKEPPQAVALSNYPWTRNLSGGMLRYIKRHVPGVATIMGGPNYSHDLERQTRFFARREFLDFYVYMEGEQPMLQLVTRLMDSGADPERTKHSPIPGVHFYDRDSKHLTRGQTIPRMVEPDTIESPYLTGLLEEFFDVDLQPFMQTTRGCPFTCTFCHEGDAYYTKVRRFSLDRIEAEMEYMARRVRREVPLQITDSNFGMFKEDLDTCRMIRRLQDKYGWPHDVLLSTGKNRTDRIAEAVRITRGAISLSLQVQTMDPEVLAKIKRKNVSIQSMMDAIAQTQEVSKTERTISAIITPLPGETHESHLETIRKLLDMDIDYLCPMTLMLLEGTEIASTQSRKQYEMVPKFRVVPNYFGSFQDIHTVEYEEICAGTNTMTPAEYLDLRGWHFFLACYHADDNMLELRRYLRNFGISDFEWLYRVKASFDRAPEGFRKVYGEFLQAAQDELWDSEEELLEFWQVPENREKFYKGELGQNLVFHFRARGMTVSLQDLIDHGARVAEEMVLERSPSADPEAVREELREVAGYVFLRRRFALSAEDAAVPIVRVFTHDFIAWEADKYARPLREYRVKEQIGIRFFYTDYQLEKVAAAFKIYGTSIQSVGIILRKHNMMFFVRETAYADSPATVSEAAENRRLWGPQARV